MGSRARRSAGCAAPPGAGDRRTAEKGFMGGCSIEAEPAAILAPAPVTAEPAPVHAPHESAAVRAPLIGPKSIVEPDCHDHRHAGQERRLESQDETPTVSG